MFYFLFMAMLPIVFAQLNRINAGLIDIVASNTPFQTFQSILNPGMIGIRVEPPGNLGLYISIRSSSGWGSSTPQYDVLFATDAQYQALRNPVGGPGSLTVFETFASTSSIERIIGESTAPGGGVWWVVIQNGAGFGVSPPDFSSLTLQISVQFGASIPTNPGPLVCSAPTLGCMCMEGGICVTGLQCASDICQNPGAFPSSSPTFPPTPAGGNCALGSLECPCMAGDTCSSGLTCIGGICYQAAACQLGAIGCACVAGIQCNFGLMCQANQCVPVPMGSPPTAGGLPPTNAGFPPTNAGFPPTNAGSAPTNQVQVPTSAPIPGLTDCTSLPQCAAAIFCQNGLVAQCQCDAGGFVRDSKCGSPSVPTVAPPINQFPPTVVPVPSPGGVVGVGGNPVCLKKCTDLCDADGVAECDCSGGLENPATIKCGKSNSTKNSLAMLMVVVLAILLTI